MLGEMLYTIPAAGYWVMFIVSMIFTVAGMGSRHGVTDLMEIPQECREEYLEAVERNK